RERSHQPNQQPVAMDGRMPVVAAAKRRRQLPRWRNVGVAVQEVADLVRIFLVHARERQLREALRRFRVKCRSSSLRCTADCWEKNKNAQKTFHASQYNRFQNS